MSYRNITVNGQVYQYTIGKTHTKIVGVGVFENGTVGDAVWFDDVGESKMMVTPSNIQKVIENLQPLAK